MSSPDGAPPPSPPSPPPPPSGPPQGPPQRPPEGSPPAGHAAERQAIAQTESGRLPAPAPAEPGFSLSDVIEHVPVKPFVDRLKLSLRRAWRLRIEPSEVLASERETLLRATPPIVEPELQAFLAWRRSLLFMVAVFLVPLTVIGLGDAIRLGDVAWQVRMVKLGPALAEALFMGICWNQLRHWANWRRQRRVLFAGWLFFLLTPFIVFIYPLRWVFESIAKQLSTKEAWLAMGIDGVYKKALQPFVFAMLAMLQLAPKVISLMPGLIRSSMVIKLLFPGSSAPGWLIAMAAPLYALFVYVILVVPYQFTGNGWFMAGILGVIVGQVMLCRAGFALARPLPEAEALVHIKRARKIYLAVMITSAVCIITALGGLTRLLHLRWTDVVTTILKFETNVLILTMIGADAVVTNLDRARQYAAGRDHMEDRDDARIAAFVSLGHTAPPPPSGSAAPPAGPR
ncbi:MAG TPA: hypothetical protein VHE35_16090 [Kofleriaceae bacterium]|nr:hypothetical protein [Kofleriaceae bacterium]